MNCGCSRPTKVAATFSSTTRRKTGGGNFFGEAGLAADISSPGDEDNYNDNNNYNNGDPYTTKLNRISNEELTNGLNDLHGVADKIVENPEMVQMKMAEMSMALDKLIARSPQQAREETVAFQMAVIKSPKYVDNLKLRFLRAEVFDSQAAASRMVRFFHVKMKYFGEGEMLVKDITLDDLKEDEMDALQNGLFQVLRQRDRAGRAVMFSYGKVSQNYTLEAACRVLFYMFMSVLEEEETQKNGLVAIYYGIGQTFVVKNSAAAYWEILWALPMRLVGFHRCQESPVSVLTPGQYILRKLVESRPLSRFRFHTGSDVECIYNLMTFGIPRDAIPINEDGTMDLTDHHRVLEVLKFRENQQKQPSQRQQQQQIKQQHKQKETINTQFERCVSPSITSVSSATATGNPNFDEEFSLSSLQEVDVIEEEEEEDAITEEGHKDNNNLNKFILVPSPMDIVLGRGRQQQRLPGYVRLNNLMEEYWDEYEAASKAGKSAIAMKVLERMKESNCRFLGVASDGYLESDDETARSRIIETFRSLRKKKKKTQGNTATATSTGKKHSSNKNNNSKKKNNTNEQYDNNDDNTKNTSRNYGGDGGTGSMKRVLSDPNFSEW